MTGCLRCRILLRSPIWISFDSDLPSLFLFEYEMRFSESSDEPEFGAALLLALLEPKMLFSTFTMILEDLLELLALTLKLIMYLPSDLLSSGCDFSESSFSP